MPIKIVLTKLSFQVRPSFQISYQQLMEEVNHVKYQIKISHIKYY